MNAKNVMFDGYAAQYDEWFMKNDNLFASELKLFQKALGNIEGKRLLSVGCGSGLFESYIDCTNVEGIEPSQDMGRIAQKRGINVIAYGTIEDVELQDQTYDIIYFNGSSSYIADLRPAYGKCRRALREGGTLPRPPGKAAINYFCTGECAEITSATVESGIVCR